jgi:hypothetical protein
MAHARSLGLARVSTSTTGTGTVTLGAAVSGFQTFANAGAVDGGVYFYAIKDGTASELGYGTYTASGTTLSRTVLQSTNSDNPINLSGTGVEVFSTIAHTSFEPSVNAQTGTSYTVLVSDFGKLVTHSNASAIAVTLPQATGLFGSGWYYCTRNLGAGTVTITPTTSTIDGAATLTLTAGSSAVIFSDGTNYQTVAFRLATTAQADAGTAADVAVTPAGLLSAATGIETIWVPAVAMYSRTTNGAGVGTAEMSTNRNMIVSLDFDPTTTEYAQFSVRMPKSWNEGTVTFVPLWSHPSTTTNFGVVWQLQAVAISDDDAQDVAFGTAQSSTDTGGTTNDLYIGPASSAITVAGSPAAQDYVLFQIYRDTANGSDTLAVDARLQGITLYVTTDAITDD